MRVILCRVSQGGGAYVMEEALLTNMLKPPVFPEAQGVIFELTSRPTRYIVCSWAKSTLDGNKFPVQTQPTPLVNRSIPIPPTSFNFRLSIRARGLGTRSQPCRPGQRGTRPPVGAMAADAEPAEAGPMKAKSWAAPASAVLRHDYPTA